MNLNATRYRLLNGTQRGFPLEPRPFARLAAELDLGEAEVLGLVERLCAEGAVSRLGPVIAPNTLGASTLAAMAVPEERLEEVAAAVSARDEVNHNYEREHRVNLWFVVTAPDAAAVAAVLAGLESETGLAILDLPLEAAYHVDLGFDLNGGGCAGVPECPGPAGNGQDRPRLDPADRLLLGAIEDGLPLTPRPYAEVARHVGLSEAEVIGRLRRLVEAGVVRRLGLVVRHHELGYRANAMALWDVPDGVVDELGRRLGTCPFVTLCYRRTRRPPEWPYNLYCMIHGRDRQRVRDQIARLNAEPGLRSRPRAVLFSRRRFKQRGARYCCAPAQAADGAA